MQEAEAILSFGSGSRKHHKTDASASLRTISRNKHFVDFSDFKSIKNFIIMLKPLKYFSHTVLFLLRLAIARHAFTKIRVTSNA